MGFVNHYTIGTDPEWIVRDRVKGAILQPHQVGLDEGSAFGSDGGGVAWELRTQPSRSALYVTAGILTCLREMVEIAPGVLNYDHIAHGYPDFPCGGHVHFGRLQKKLSPGEVERLSRMTDTLVNPNVDWAFWEGWKLRIHHGVYGRVGDVRTQKYGYEYRTPPTFISTPWQAFVWLTCLKLAPLQPGTPEEVLKHFKDRDQDAALALEILNTKQQRHTTQNILPQWGFPGVAPPGLRGRAIRLDRVFIPAYLSPTTEDVKAIQHSLEHLQPPVVSLLQPQRCKNMAPWCMDLEVAPGFAGLGEICSGLCTSDGWHVLIKGATREMAVPDQTLIIFPPQGFTGRERLQADAPGMVHKILRNVKIDYRAGRTRNWEVWISSWLRGKTGPPGIAAKTRKLLLSGLLPIWEVSQIGETAPTWPHFEIKNMIRPAQILQEVL